MRKKPHGSSAAQPIKTGTYIYFFARQGRQPSHRDKHRRIGRQPFASMAAQGAGHTALRIGINTEDRQAAMRTRENTGGEATCLALLLLMPCLSVIWKYPYSSGKRAPFPRALPHRNRAFQLPFHHCSRRVPQV